MSSKHCILGIETSCDETSAAVYTSSQGLLSNSIYSQVAKHEQYGGVVPEVACREHNTKLPIVVQQALQDAGVGYTDLTGVAVTSKPGLPGALQTGVCFAKGLAYAHGLPVLGVDHLQGHVYSACVEQEVAFPFLCLTVSGGHTALYHVQDFETYTMLGSTRDDAAGEAFDKVAKLIGLPYPGGPHIEKYAQEYGFQDDFEYSRGALGGFDFSFSGLKTAVLYDLVDRGAYDLATRTFLRAGDTRFARQVASSLLVCIKDIFIKKLDYAHKQYPDIKSICFVGGVACNKYLRRHILEWAEQRKVRLYVPSPVLCTDNAGMIAFVGCKKAEKNQFSGYDISIL